MDHVPETVETEFAKALVLAIVGGLVALVKKVPALFRRQGPARERAVEAEVARSAGVLAAGDEREIARLEAGWEALLRGLLAEHPDAAPELAALAAEIRAALGPAPATLYQQHVSGGSTGAQGPGATVNIYRRDRD